MSVLQFLRKTALWILITPLALGYLGALSNQVVLYANHDTFPVSVNPVKLQVFTGGHSEPDPTDPTGGRILAIGGHTVTLPDGTVMMDPTHCVMTSKTHLNLLADVFDFHDSIESIGDLMFDFGGWSWTFAPYVWGFAVIGKLRKQD